MALQGTVDFTERDSLMALAHHWRFSDAERVVTEDW
jgi:hypothetical protein